MDFGSIGVVAVVAAAVPLTGQVGRRAARRLGQPGIIGEIALCLLLGAALTARLGWVAPGSAEQRLLDLVGHAGLALFLVGAGHEIRLNAGRVSPRTVAWVSVGSALVPMACGTVFAVWVLDTGGPVLRGEAPTAALVVMLAVALAVTAVPVLAGILRDRRMQHTDHGRLAMASAVSIDAVTWVLLTLAVSLANGHGTGVARAVTVVGAGIVAVVLLRWPLNTRPVRAMAARHRLLTASLVAAAAYGASRATLELGLTDVFGAVLVGLALPTDGAARHPHEKPAATDGGAGPWSRAVRIPSGLGRWMLPYLFALSGASLARAPHSGFAWSAMLLATALAIASKLTGTYAGARLGAQPPLGALRLAALMNTRGLTEIVMLQAGYTAHILTPALYLALVVMALVTTSMSGPLLWAVDRYARSTSTNSAPGEPGLRLADG